MNKPLWPTVSLWLLCTASAASSLKVVWRDEDPPVQVVYAVNVCGPTVTVNGTTYEKDTSDVGYDDCIGDNMDKTEATLHTHYREENEFNYDLPVPTDGHYVLRLGQGDANPRPFDVFLNGRHKLTSVNNHFQVVDGLLKYKDEESHMSQAKRSVRLSFSGHHNSAGTVASILLVRGELADLKAAQWVPGDKGSESEYQPKVLQLLSQILTTLKEQNELIKNKVN